MIWSEVMASETSPYPWARCPAGLNEVFSARFATREEAEDLPAAVPRAVYRIVNTDTGEVAPLPEPC